MYGRQQAARLTGVSNDVSEGTSASYVDLDVGEEPSISLSQLIAEYEKRKVDSKKWRESTVRNDRPKMNAMLQVFGKDRPVDQISVQDVREFAKIM